jgi:8-oxo-dGTP pyrophosphatase MutT (NUDIX family)
MKDDQSPKEWVCEASEKGPELKIFNVRFDHMRNPRNGVRERMVILESPDAANVVALDAQQQILFVRQYRFGIGRYTLELPGGMVEPSEPQEQAVQRELKEETGAVATTWTYLGRIPSNPVFQDSYIYHWWAQGAAIDATPQLDDGEEIFLEWIPEAEVHHQLMSGQFEHPHTVNALLLYFYAKSQGQ